MEKLLNDGNREKKNLFGKLAYFIIFLKIL